MFERLKGAPPMPWQAQWFDVIGEMVRDDETGILVPAYPETFATLMRQQGKTGQAEAWFWHRAVMWEAWDQKPQAIAYTAQRGADGRAKFRKDLLPAWKRSPLWKFADRPRFMADDTGMSWKNGANLTFLNTSESSGHGLVLDAAFMDEIFADQDDRRDQTLVPAMATRHDSQKSVASTAGDQKSTLFLRKQRQGRANVDAGRTEGSAYVEFSADRSDPQYDPESPSTWRQCMPALGVTITERTVRNAFDQMANDPEKGVAEFERAWLNISKGASGDDWSEILEGWWDAVAHPDVSPARASAVVAIDARRDGSNASIVAADASGTLAVLASSPDTWWVAEWLLERRDQRHTIVVDAGGPLASVGDDLESAGLRIERVGFAEVKKAATSLRDAFADGQIRVRTSAEMKAAVKRASRRMSGDSWLWDRDVEGGDLMTAASIARWKAKESRLIRPTVTVL